MKYRLLILSLLVIAIIISSCEGPVGPPGRDAVVEIYNSTITILESDFTAEDEFVSVAEYGWSDLDEATVDFGIVLGYLRFQGTTAWHPLPFTVPFDSDVVVLRYNFDIDSFNLILEGEVADNNNANEALFDGDLLRVVAIPPDRVLKMKIDYSDYNQVAKHYGLD